MKKYFILLAFLIFSGPVYTPVENKFKKLVAAVPFKTPVLSKMVVPDPIKTASETRAPAQVRPTPIQPRRLSQFVVKDPSLKSSTGEWIATNITALPLSSYDPSFGKEIYRDKYFAYFEGKTDESLPVAFNPVDQRFHPLSQVLLLKKIDEGLRQEIIDEGHKEYYYNQRMGFLSIQSTSQEVLSLYSEFKKRGLDVRLEVLKETAKPN